MIYLIILITYLICGLIGCILTYIIQKKTIELAYYAKPQRLKTNPKWDNAPNWIKKKVLSLGLSSRSHSPPWQIVWFFGLILLVSIITVFSV